MLSERERLTLNHIRAHEYLSLFGLVEEFILPFVLDHARTIVNGDDYRIRAYLELHDTVLIPVGATEQYGAHLATGAELRICEMMATEVGAATGLNTAVPWRWA